MLRHRTLRSNATHPSNGCDMLATSKRAAEGWRIVVLVLTLVIFAGVADGQNDAFQSIPDTRLSSNESAATVSRRRGPTCASVEEIAPTSHEETVPQARGLAI
jgi:hypothetical protein